MTGGPGKSRGRSTGGIVLSAFCLGLCAIGATGRVEAWPEQLVPAYLLTKGFHLYSEIKFAHSPLLIGLYALLFGTFGFREVVLRAAATLPALAALVFVWRSLARRGAGLAARSVAAGFVLATVPLWRSLAIYPDPWLAILAIPLLDSLVKLDRDDVSRAGWISGVGIAIKQTAIVAAIFAAAVVFVRRGPREGARFLARMAAPMAAFGAVFLAAGAGRSFFRWTVTVPLVFYRGRTTLAPTASDLTMLLPGLLPAAALWLSWRKIPAADRLIAMGLLVSFSAVAVPKFEFLHMAATIPILAWMAGRAFAGSAAPWVAGTGVALNAILAATSPSPGGVAFWSSKSDDAAVAWIKRQPPAPLFLYGVDQNLFIRSDRIPPGRLYNNPDLWYHYLAEDLEARQIEALRANPETIVLEGRKVPVGDAGGSLARFLAAEYAPAGVVAPGASRLVPRDLVRTACAGGLTGEARPPPPP